MTISETLKDSGVLTFLFASSTVSNFFDDNHISRETQEDPFVVQQVAVICATSNAAPEVWRYYHLLLGKVWRLFFKLRVSVASLENCLRPLILPEHCLTQHQIKY